MERLFLLDAYAIIYRAYYAFFKNPRINSKGLNTSAILGFVNTLEEIIAKEKPTHLGVAFDPAGGTFRHELYKEYKAQREETPETIKESVPIIKEIIKAYNIPILEVAGFEADDVIGTLSKQADEKGGIETYMLTPDKDYCQLVSDTSFVYRPRYGDSGYEVMTPKIVKEKYEISDTSQIIDLLGLMGDSSDNIPGCPGVGPKTAQKLIAEFGNIENILANTDKLKGSVKNKIEENKEKIEFSKLLATIRRDVPIELDMEMLKVEKPDLKKIKDLFTELEFRTLINRLAERENNNISTNSETKPTSTKNDGFSGDLFDVFVDNDTDIFKNSNLSDIKSTYHNYYLVDNVEDVKQLCAKILDTKFCCFDTETSGINPITAKLVGISFSIKEHEAFYIPITTDEEKNREIVSIVKNVLEDEDILKIGQNIKYDILVLSNLGIDVKGQMFDTMIAHYLLQPELHHGMDYLAEIYLNYKTIHIEELIGEKGKHQGNMANLFPEQVYEYACEDADITLQLKNILEAELKKDGTYTLFNEIEMPLVKVLAYMEKNGVRLDTVSLKETSEVFNGRMKSIEKDIFSLADLTFGGGGHTKEILSRLSPKGRVLVFDLDKEAIANCPADKRVIFVNQNYRYLWNYLRYYDAIPVDGILGDLGISSHQIDCDERGFAIRKDGNLDMRMNNSSGKSAKDVLNTYSEDDLMRVFKEYGEIDKPYYLVRDIVAYRDRHSVFFFISGFIRIDTHTAGYQHTANKIY